MQMNLLRKVSLLEFRAASSSDAVKPTPCARSWGDVAVPELRDFAGAEPNVVEADEPFRVNPI